MNGECEEVWDDIRRLGPVPAVLASDVDAVAMETMRRVLRHVPRIVDGATSVRFMPGFPDLGPHLEPTEDIGGT